MIQTTHLNDLLNSQLKAGYRLCTRGAKIKHNLTMDYGWYMLTGIQPNANHKFVDMLSNGKVNLSSNPLDEIELIQRGLDIKSVEKFRLELRWDIQSFAKSIGTNTRTFERHIKEHKRLNATLSENTFELAHLAAICIDYHENIERWNKWLNTCSLQFSSKTPLTFVNTIAGRRLIRNAVNSLKHGYNA